MTRRNWKRIYPTSLREAMELCVKHAEEKHNYSVERIAELMGMSSHWTLYKWIPEAAMPIKKVTPFENVCGIDLVTQFQAHSNNKLLVPIPTGRRAEHKELNDLVHFQSKTAQLLYDHSDGKRSSEEVIGAITQLMEDLAWQKGNAEKDIQPELEL